MTEEAEAKRLYDKYLKVIKKRTDVWIAGSYISFARECATICAERMEEFIRGTPMSEVKSLSRKGQLEHWQAVKKHIETVK